ncbi:heterokaryon incompatibility protein [Stemphylium lycopersici]|nr:heterokaryon incompatibility protein [Stemphylium lycopersici]
MATSRRPSCQSYYPHPLTHPAPPRPLHREIRVLDLLPGLSPSPIHCNLRIVNLDGDIAYEALSYVWGSPPSRKTIHISNAPIEVTPNLYNALLRLRDPVKKRVLWVDQICINQWDVEEKASQVAMMRDIYRKCRHCVIWLGEVPYDEYKIGEADARAVFDFLKSVASGWDQRISASDDYMTHVHVQNADADALPTLFESSDAGSAARRAFAAFAMYGNPWWERVWTIQESILPQSATFLWGPLSVSRQDVFDTVQRLRGDRLYSFPLDFQKQRVFHTPLLRSLFHPVFGFLRSREGEAELDTFMRWRHRKATDPRDKVYALLGLLPPKPGVAILPHASACSYSTPAPILFAKATRDLLVAEKDLRSLVASSEMVHITPGLPTWAIDFACSNRVGKRQLRWWNHSHRYREFNACSSHAARTNLVDPAFDIQDASDWRMLCLEGVLVDTVSLVNSIYTVSDDADLDYQRIASTISSAELLLQSYLASHPSLKTHPSGDDEYATALWRTLIGDLIMAEYPLGRAKESNSEDYFQLRNALASQQSSSTSRPSVLENVLFSSLCGMVPNHAFFIMEKGHLGMGPPDMRLGDQVWVLHGGNVPFVMRERLQGDGLHLVGDAYVHGIMDGQAVIGKQDLQTVRIY